MNLKIFTTALMATAATAQSAGQDNSLGDALHQKYNEMPAHIQRRFWVRILSQLIEKLLTNYSA